jgi:hypothetical protein
MNRRKGDLPGRYVPPHIRKWPRRPRDYINIRAYQEHIDPIPAKTSRRPRQLEFDFRSNEGEDRPT